MSTHGLVVVALWCCFLLPVAGAAQTALGGAIVGVVRDTSGAVLRSVTVEAAGPALIDKARTTVTDDQGRYRIVDLRPRTQDVFSREQIDALPVRPASGRLHRQA